MLRTQSARAAKRSSDGGDGGHAIGMVEVMHADVAQRAAAALRFAAS
jgi:hypothetical protein